MQLHDDGHWHLVMCGSRFLKDVETRYAMIEIESLAIEFAVKKCRRYLAGAPTFTIVTNHKPLVPLFNKYQLSQVENAKVQKIKSNLQSQYQFVVEWRPGKRHFIADGLSRAPVDDDDDEDEDDDVDTSGTIVAALQLATNEVDGDDDDEADEQSKNSIDPLIEEMTKAAKADKEYVALVDEIRNDFRNAMSSIPFVQQFRAISENLSVDDGLVLFGPRLVMPLAKRKDVLLHLHASHQGITRTQQRARSCVYWPGISNEIRQIVDRCSKCQEKRASTPKETLKTDPRPTRPFEHVASDLFTYAGRHYLVYVCRYSGFVMVADWNDDPTANQVTSKCQQYFATLGVPTTFRSDNGPQYNSANFKKFLQRWGVIHNPSTPYYPQANYAEVAVKKCKSMISKLTSTKLDTEEFAEAILELRNTPGVDGRSPNEIVFGTNLRSRVPVHHTAFDERWKKAADEADLKRSRITQKAEAYYNYSAKDLKPLKVGTQVRLQDPSTKRWDSVGEVVGKGKYRDYRIKTASGRTYWRNRRFIRKYNGALEDENDDVSDENNDENDNSTPTELRRSTRDKKKIVRFAAQ